MPHNALPPTHPPPVMEPLGFQPWSVQTAEAWQQSKKGLRMAEVSEAFEAVESFGMQLILLFVFATLANFSDIFCCYIYIYMYVPGSMS